MSTREMTASRPWAGLERLRLGRWARKRALVSLVVALLLAAAVWLVLGQVASYPRILHALSRADAWWLLLAAGGLVLGYLGYALLYQVFSRVEDGPQPKLQVALRVGLAAFGASVIATSAGRLGAEYWSLRRMGERPPHAWSRVLALNTAAWAVLAVLACAGAAVLLLAGSGGVPLGVELGWLLALPVCAVPALYLSSPARRSLAEDRGGRTRRLAASVVRSLVLIRVAGAGRRDRLHSVGGGLLYWTGEMLIVWAALKAFGVSLGPAALVIGYATGYASTMLPLPAGGVDAASTFALTLVGVPLSAALLATLVQRLFSYWLPITLAGLSLRSIKRLRTDLPHVVRPVPPTQPGA